jgi:diacylglycerol kinase family enzyme
MINAKKRIHFLANAKSGKGQGQTLSEQAKKICDELNIELVVYPIQQPDELESRTREAVKAAEGSVDDRILAAGGDGTIRTVAATIFGSKVPLAVVPCGTFNFFARTYSIPENHEEALRLAMTGPIKPVRLGEINDKIFLINASLGIYAKSIQDRELNTSRFGRKQLVVIFSTIRSLLKRHRLLHVLLKVDDMVKEIHTPLIFIGNNALQMRNLSLSVAKGFRRDLLAVVTLKPIQGWEMLKVIFRGVTKTLENEKNLIQFSTDSLTIETKRNPQTVALDGELFNMSSPFKIYSLPDALNLIVPEEAVKDIST